MQPPKKNRSLTNLLEAAEEACRSKMINMKRTSSGSSSKQKQRTGPTTELCLEHFGQFLTHTLSLEVEAQCVHRLEACLAHDQFQNTLNCMELALHSILESYPGLDGLVVAEIHTYLGLVYLEQQKNSAAVDSFTKDVWLKSHTPEDTFGIARANHRLGLAYGRNKEYQQAIVLLDKAIEAYDTSSDIYVIAKEDRHEFQEAEQLELLRRSRPKAIHREAASRSRSPRASTSRSPSRVRRSPISGRRFARTSRRTTMDMTASTSTDAPKPRRRLLSRQKTL